MICPKCEYEYVEGITKCADCGEDLITSQDFEGHLVHHSDWVVIYHTSENYEAEMLRANLEGAGVETQILQQKDRSYPAVGDLAVVKILVKKSDAESAKTIIDDINSSEGNSGEEG